MILSLESIAQVSRPTSGSNCALPTDLQSAISKKYQGSKVLSLADMVEDDRSFFQKDHGDRCPGLVQVDFYGDSKPTWAIILLTGEEQKRQAKLVVAHKPDKSWRVTLLETAGESAPAVWSEGKGEYTDVYGEKKISARRPVIVLCKYESWAILYSWSGTKVEKIWIAD
jgi:hypothetical protein